jgi:hypothetical protein
MEPHYLNKHFYPTYVISDQYLKFFKTKSIQNLWAFFWKQIVPKLLGDIFQRKNAPNAKKFRPYGEISPNLVTLRPTNLGVGRFLKQDVSSV